MFFDNESERSFKWNYGTELVTPIFSAAIFWTVGPTQGFGITRLLADSKSAPKPKNQKSLDNEQHCIYQYFFELEI